MRILIADNQAKVRRALRVLLEQSAQDQIVGEADSAAGLLAQMAGAAADLVLLDVNLPGLGMAALLAALRQARTELRVIALSTHMEDGRAALAAGADAFVSKAEPAECLLAAIADCRRAVEGMDCG